MHQAHIWTIVDATSLKEGYTKGLRHLHNDVNQHLWGLKAINYDPSGLSITSVLKLKWDQATKFESQ